MITNFNRERFFVLTNDENKIIAIIKCEAGIHDITDKLYDAISEDYDAEKVEIRTKDLIIESFDYEQSFTVKIFGNDDNDPYKETFTLTTTAIY
jgi:hypothetical protein